VTQNILVYILNKTSLIKIFTIYVPLTLLICLTKKV